MPTGTSSTPASERQVIFVGDHRALVEAAAKVASRPLPDPLADAMVIASRMAMAMVEVAYEVYSRRALRKSSTEELTQILAEGLRLGSPVFAYSPTEARALFKFDVGHSPRNGSVYVQRPLMPEAYIAPEEFSRTLAREKEAAFRQLASALGAKELRLVTASVREERGRFGTKVSAPEVATDVGIKVQFDSNGGLTKQVYSRFGPPRSPPHVPKDLQPWVEMDADLRTMARDRLEGHLLENRITLEFREGMGVGGEVAAKVAGRGLTAGGKYTALSRSVWQFEAEYWPLDR